MSLNGDCIYSLGLANSTRINIPLRPQADSGDAAGGPVEGSRRRLIERRKSEETAVSTRGRGSRERLELHNGVRGELLLSVAIATLLTSATLNFLASWEPRLLTGPLNPPMLRLR